MEDPSKIEHTWEHPASFFSQREFISYELIFVDKFKYFSGLHWVIHLHLHVSFNTFYSLMFILDHISWSIYFFIIVLFSPCIIIFKYI